MSLTPKQLSLTLLLIALNPAAIYFSTLYAEPWTLLFTLASIEFGYYQKWGFAALAGGLAALTQATGVLVGLFPLIAFFDALFKGRWRYTIGPFIWGIGCFIGIAVYAIYLGVRFHHPLLFSTVQVRGWQSTWVWPWSQWTNQFFKLTRGDLPPIYALIFLSITIFILGLLQLWFLAWKSGWTRNPEITSATLYATVGLLVSLSFLALNISFHSTLRIASVYFPIYAGISRYRWIGLLSLVCFTILCVVGAGLFTHQWFYQ